jgi:sugar phosphate permease
MVNTANQVGGSIGIALLSTFFADAIADASAKNPSITEAAASIEGYTAVFWWAAGISIVSALVVLALVKNPPPGDLDTGTAGGAH